MEGGVQRRAVVGGGLAVVGESGQRRAEAGGDGRGEMGEVKRVGSGGGGGGGQRWAEVDGGWRATRGVFVSVCGCGWVCVCGCVCVYARWRVVCEPTIIQPTTTLPLPPPNILPPAPHPRPAGST